MTREAVSGAVQRWLASRSWLARRNERVGFYEIGIKLDCTLAKVRLIADPQDNGCLFYVIPQLSCPSERMAELSRFMTLANYGLINGNFELDMRTGDFRYKCFVSCVGLNDLPVETIDSTVRTACGTFERYADGLSRVVLMAADANEEIMRIELRQAMR